jgi:hypothetical protein
MADVFISHKCEDRAWAEKIDNLIRGKGYSTWWDASIQTGERYNDRIDRELRRAAAAVVIWSSRSWESPWVKEEALFARDRDRLLPARIDDVQIGVPFYSLQTIDLRGWDGTPDHARAKDLVDGLGRLLPKTLREDYSVNVYWTTGDNKYAGDKQKVERFLARVAAACSCIGLELNLIPAWDHIENPLKIADRSVYEKDLNILLIIGDMEICGFFEDVFAPGLRQLARELNPFVVHISHQEFRMDYLNFYCAPNRRVETVSEELPEPDTLIGDSVVEAVSSHIALKALRVRQNLALRSHIESHR